MKIPRTVFTFCVCLLVLMTAATAFAQVTPAPAPAPTLTMTTAVVTLLSMIAGVLTNWIQSGVLLGRWVTPKSWLPDLTMISTALAGFLGYVMSQNPVALTPAILFYGIVAAVGALVAGAAPSFATHAHSTLPAQRRAALALVKSAAAAAAPAATVLVLLVGLGGSTSGCNGQPVLPTVVNIENIVVRDIQAGDSPAQIDSDVCQALGGSAPTDTVCAAATVLVQDAIQLFLDSGKATPAQLVTAQAYLAVHPKAGGSK